MSSILVVAPHPDDETLGCGGTLLKHRQQGDRINWLIMTRTWSPKYTERDIQQQETQIKAVDRAYSFAHTEWLHFKTTTLDSIPLNEIIDAIRNVIAKVKPETVYIPSAVDIHSDHQVVVQGVMAVLKPFYMRSLGVRRILACEILSETDASISGFRGTFSPNIYHDISDTYDAKLEIMKLFQTEVQPEPFPRSLSSIQALARTRGASIGVKYAEAFMLIREVG